MDDVAWIKGFTNTGGALEKVRTGMFASGRQVPRVIVVVTDGESTDTEKLHREAEALKKLGVTIYMVGVGDKINEAELNVVASGPEYIYATRNYDSISKIKK